MKSRTQKAGMNVEAKPVLRPWQRFLRFSLRGLIVLLLVIGVWLGWLVRSARIQREAVAAIKNAGGSVLYDWQWKDGKELDRGEPFAPRWLVQQLGVDFFGNVAEVWGGYHPGEAVMVQVEKLDRLETLELSFSPMTDASLVHVTRLHALKELWLDDTQVTDSGLAHLKGLMNLQKLYITNTNISDEGLVHLSRLTSLRDLMLENDDVSDRGLVHLKKLARLEILGIRGTKVTDGALVHLREMKALKTLLLDEASLSDSSVRELQRALPATEICRWPTDHEFKSGNPDKAGCE